MNIHSTEDERYEELKDRVLSVYEWDDSKSLKLTDPGESVSKALKRQAKELGLIGTFVNLEGIYENVQINMPTIKESIASMTKQHADLYNLSKLFTCFHDVLENSILIDIEEYRHKSQDQRAKEIVGEYQYISAFCDEDKIYPVKITAERRKSFTDTNVHVTVTIGDLDLDKIKEDPSILRVHQSHNERESSDSGRVSSFDISLPHFVQNLNETHAILLKNFPDQMLNADQQKIKEKLVHFDKEKDTARMLALYTDQISEALERGEDLVYKVVPREYEIQIKQSMLDSGICFVEFPTELNGAWYKTIAVQQKDRDTFEDVWRDTLKELSFKGPGKQQAEKVTEKQKLESELDADMQYDEYEDGYAMYDDDCMDFDDYDDYER